MGIISPIVWTLWTGLTLDWAHRDRLLQTSGVYEDFEDGNIGPEPGTVYNVSILKYLLAGGTEIVAETGITGTSYTLPSVGGNPIGYGNFDGASEIEYPSFNITDNLKVEVSIRKTSTLPASGGSIVGKFSGSNNRSWFMSIISTGELPRISV